MTLPGSNERERAPRSDRVAVSLESTFQKRLRRFIGCECSILLPFGELKVRQFALAGISYRFYPQAIAIIRRVREYLDRLNALGLDDRDLRREIGRPEILLKIARHCLLLGLWVPLAAPGAFFHAPIIVIARYAGRYLTPRKDVMATTKLVVGMALVLVGHVALSFLFGWLYGLRVGLGVAVFIPLSGYALLVVLDRSLAVRRATSTFLRLTTLNDEIESLRKERNELEAVVIQGVEHFRPSDMVPLFPRA